MLAFVAGLYRETGRSVLLGAGGTQVCFKEGHLGARSFVRTW